MEILIILAFGVAYHVLKSREQKRRITLLGGYLGRFEIEKLMEGLMEGYLRALGETSPERQTQVWEHLRTQEERLRDQFSEFSKDFAGVWADDARVSTLPIAFPMADKLFPAATFDVRQAFKLHAQGIENGVSHSQHLQDKDRAFLLMAELLLMQHTCHWFCRSKTVASARLLARHKTHYAQVLESVSPQTRQAYIKLLITQPIFKQK
jgi:hypothetical protein